MSTAAGENLSKCAACGRAGDGLKACKGCKLVKYCNAACQKEHRPKHKKECQKRASDLFDEALFKQPPNDDGLTCFLREDITLRLPAGDPMYSTSHYNIGVAYFNGEGVRRDETKAKHFWELAAIGGSVEARHNLGCLEMDDGNADRAMKHWMIAVGGGNDKSLTAISKGYATGHVTKDDFEMALRLYQEAADAMKNTQREDVDIVETPDAIETVECLD